MTIEWVPENTTTHQDHVIAHVIGSTVLGYFILDEALYILLDIGFIWTVYLDGEMGLLPHPVAIGELETVEEVRAQIRTDVDVLLRDGFGVEELAHLVPPPVNCLIEEVTFFTNGDERRLLVAGEKESLAVETSVRTGEISVLGL